MDTRQTYHVGIILDGNGRWATAKNKPRLFGHSAGEKNVNKIIRACPANNVGILSLYAFAIANWKRDKTEVNGLWNIFRNFFKYELNDIMEFGAKLKMIGNRDGIPKDILAMVCQAEEESKNNTKVTVLIALNYDGVEEVARATQKIANEVLAGEIEIKDITPECIEKHLDTGDYSLPDIIIRTGMPKTNNEKGMAVWRSSSFLQLQSAQSVCISTSVLWPDFSAEDLRNAITIAKPEDRLFGGQRI